MKKKEVTLKQKISKHAFTLSEGKRNPQIIHSERSEESSKLGFQPNKVGSNVQFIAPKQDGMSGSFGKPQDGRRVAFTLAEVLITLGIIGVVAALVLPPLVDKINTRVKTKRIENIKQKLGKVMDKMASLDVLMGHANTHDFVYEMNKHMAIAKICENGEIEKCWPTLTVNYKDGSTYEIAKVKTPKHLKIDLRPEDDWDNPMAIVTGDGTSMIISYNKNCNFNIDKDGLKYQRFITIDDKKDNGDGISNTLMSRCLAVVYDWNGGGRPNMLGEDINTLDAAIGIGKVCAYQTKSGLCIASAAHLPVPMTKADCEAAVAEGKLGIKYCQHNPDYWAGAVKECGGIDKMFKQAELAQIATEIYGKTVAESGETSNLNFDAARSLALGLPSSGLFYIWSGEEHTSHRSYYWYYNSSVSGESDYYSRNGLFIAGGYPRLVLCKGE